jgi:hypothetical protein
MDVVVLMYIYNLGLSFLGFLFWFIIFKNLKSEEDKWPGNKFWSSIWISLSYPASVVIVERQAWERAKRNMVDNQYSGDWSW